MKTAEAWKGVSSIRPVTQNATRIGRHITLTA
jgi:hypothetical protein